MVMITAIVKRKKKIFKWDSLDALRRDWLSDGWTGPGPKDRVTFASYNGFMLPDHLQHAAFGRVMDHLRYTHAREYYGYQ